MEALNKLHCLYPNEKLKQVKAIDIGSGLGTFLNILITYISNHDDFELKRIVGVEIDKKRFEESLHCENQVLLLHRSYYNISAAAVFKCMDAKDLKSLVSDDIFVWSNVMYLIWIWIYIGWFQCDLLV